MGAHAAPRPRTLAGVAGRGALTAAAALALTGGTATFAFAGTEHDGWSKDHDSEYKDGFRDGYRIGYHDGENADDEDCDDDGDRDHGRWDRDHDKKWDRDHDKKWDRDHDKKWDRDHDKKWDRDRGGNIGARYDDSVHKGDDIYTVNYVTKNGLLAGVL